MLTIKADTSKLRASLIERGAALHRAMRSDDFCTRVQSYLTGVTTRFMTKMGRGLQEQPDSRTERGVTWNGWATWTVHKWGRDVPESTRAYWRGFRRGQASSETVAKRYAKARAAARSGMLALEKAWKKRGGGKNVRYHGNDTMLQSTGHLRNFTMFIRRFWRGASLVLRAGQQVEYFGRQHERRPIWFVYPPEDGPKIAKILEGKVREVLRA